MKKKVTIEAEIDESRLDGEVNRYKEHLIIASLLSQISTELREGLAMGTVKVGSHSRADWELSEGN